MMPATMQTGSMKHRRESSGRPEPRSARSGPPCTDHAPPSAVAAASVRSPASPCTANQWQHRSAAPVMDGQFALELTTSAAPSGAAAFQRVAMPDTDEPAALACCGSRQPHAEACDIRNSDVRRSHFRHPSTNAAAGHPLTRDRLRVSFPSGVAGGGVFPRRACARRAWRCSTQSRPLVSDSPSAASAPASLVAVRANLRKCEPCCSASRAARTTSIFEVSRAYARCPTTPAAAR